MHRYLRLVMLLALCLATANALVGCNDQTGQSGVAAQTRSAATTGGKQGTPPSGSPVETRPTPAVQAIFDNDIQRLTALLDAGADVNEQDANWYSLLHHAIRNERYEMVELLIERGANVNIRARLNITPLLWAVRSHNLDICKLLVENGADPTLRGAADNVHTPLSYAVQQNFLDIVEYLTSVGAPM